MTEAQNWSVIAVLQYISRGPPADFNPACISSETRYLRVDSRKTRRTLHFDGRGRIWIRQNYSHVSVRPVTRPPSFVAQQIWVAGPVASRDVVKPESRLAIQAAQRTSVQTSRVTS